MFLVMHGVRQVTLLVLSKCLSFPSKIGNVTEISQTKLILSQWWYPAVVTCYIMNTTGTSESSLEASDSVKVLTFLYLSFSLAFALKKEGRSDDRKQLWTNILSSRAPECLDDIAVGNENKIQMLEIQICVCVLSSVKGIIETNNHSHSHLRAI